MIPAPIAPPAPSTRPTFIDLFCGCGGFTVGMLRAGLHCQAAIDFNPEAIATLRANLQSKSPTRLPPVGFALEADLTVLTPAILSAIIGTNKIDVIVGGPPCQGFSTARQRDGSNHGTERLKDDPRRHLFREFLRHVDHFQPKIFVIENVLGLRSAGGGRYFTAVQHESRILGQADGRPGYRVHSQIEEGVKLGVPQKRRRQLIIGVRADLPGYFPTELKRTSRAKLGTMLGDAILDLPPLIAGSGENKCAYDLDRRNVKFFCGERDNYRRRYLRKVAEVQKAAVLTNHEARPHSARDLRDFALIPEGSSSAELMRAGVAFEFPYDKTTFKDRYTRQHRNRACSTIVAHLSKDGLMFIHPTQNRSLTPREAARVQSFPDWFVFPAARTHSFRQIGNAVPPLVSEAVGDAVRTFLRALDRPAQQARTPLRSSASSIPADAEQAAKRLHVLMHCDQRQLRALDTVTFVQSWHSLLWLFPGLHPDNALDHGPEKHDWPEAETVLPGIAPSHRQVHVRSGWPVALVLIGEEAWRRFSARELDRNSFYCSEAQASGIKLRPQSLPMNSNPAQTSGAVIQNP
jgi:DNA (cytosine-5)-methyltransferase 1